MTESITLGVALDEVREVWGFRTVGVGRGHRPGAVAARGLPLPGLPNPASRFPVFYL